MAVKSSNRVSAQVESKSNGNGIAEKAIAQTVQAHNVPKSVALQSDGVLFSFMLEASQEKGVKSSTTFKTDADPKDGRVVSIGGNILTRNVYAADAAAEFAAHGAKAMGKLTATIPGADKAAKQSLSGLSGTTTARGLETFSAAGLL